jgi:hypothetical protein
MQLQDDISLIAQKVGWGPPRLPQPAGTDLSNAPLVTGTRDPGDRTRSTLILGGDVGAGGVPAAVYMFNASAGFINLTVTGVEAFETGGSTLPCTNIDLVLEVRDLSGSFMRTYDAPGFLNTSSWSADIAQPGGPPVLPADGLYYVIVRGTGKDGAYSSYASLGKYTLKVEYPTDANGQFADAFR